MHLLKVFLQILSSSSGVFGHMYAKCLPSPGDWWSMREFEFKLNLKYAKSLLVMLKNVECMILP